MSTKHPRIQVTLSEKLHKIVAQIAKEEEISLSQAVRKLVKIALQIKER